MSRHTRVRAGSGVEIFRGLIESTVARGLGGLHHFAGIPSTVGGAIRQNLHFLSPAPARERTVFIAEVVESCELMAPPRKPEVECTTLHAPLPVSQLEE